MINRPNPNPILGPTGEVMEGPTGQGYNKPLVSDFANKDWAKDRLDYYPPTKDIKLRDGDIIAWYDPAHGVHHSAVYIGQGAQGRDLVMYQSPTEGLKTMEIDGLTRLFQKYKSFEGGPVVRRLK